VSRVRLPPRKGPLPERVIVLEHKVEKFPETRHAWNSDFIDRCRKAAELCGYALTVHGTLMRDIDLVAVAWTEDADDIWKFLGVFLAQTGLYVHSIEAKPHGRIAMTMRGAYGADRDVDLSIIPPSRAAN
jgi:hypothetical protein